MKKSSFKKKLMHYLGAEIWIEYKTCLYSYCIMVFYCAFLLSHRIYQARILWKDLQGLAGDGRKYYSLYWRRRGKE